ncbi:hypothetical protein [Nocardiopsis sp. NPDC055824]
MAPPAALGMVTAGAGIAVAAFAPGPVAFCLVSSLVGLGTGVFSTHVGPLFMAACPSGAVGRAHAVLTLAQWLPLLVANPVIGVLARAHPVSVLLLLWGAGACAAGAAALGTRAFRTAVLSGGTRRGEQEPETG